MKRCVVFASGSGSNFEALVQASCNHSLNAEVVGLICDQAQAFCLERAERLGIPSRLFLKADYTDKADMESAMRQACEQWQADVIVLAGYMRIIGPTLLAAYPKRILNIHPSLLPKYKGKDALGQALAMGDSVLGVSVHLVDEGLDTGPIILQESFTIDPKTPRSDIEIQLHALEHSLYPRAINTYLKENL